MMVTGCLGDDETDDSTPPADDADAVDDDTDDPTPPADDADADDDDSNGPEDDSGDDTGEPDEPTVFVRSNPEYGDILVGPEEMTLYNFDADTQGDEDSACDDDCTENWPPLTVEESPIAGPDVTAELTTFERDDETTQVAANGWPLYYFAGDEDPDDTAGHGVNDVWWVLTPDGTPMREDDDDEEVADDDDYEDGEDDADATVTVGADGNHFEPDTLEIEQGDTVAFVWEEGGHNIVVTEQPSDASWDGVDETQEAGYTHSHTFEVSGDYEYICEPHEAAGMDGSIHVAADAPPDDDGGYGY